MIKVGDLDLDAEMPKISCSFFLRALREHGLLPHRATRGEDLALARRDRCERLALGPIPWPRACICSPKINNQRDTGLLRRVRPAVMQQRLIEYNHVTSLNSIKNVLARQVDPLGVDLKVRFM